MDLNSNRWFFPASGRLLIPAATTPSAPYAVMIQAQAKNLEYIEISVPQASVLQDLGLRILSNEGILYPVIGSASDSNFTNGTDSFGAMAFSGSPLHLPFNRRLLGSPYTLIFEFYNSGAGAVAVNILAVTSEEKPARIEIPPRKEAVNDAA